MRNYIRVVDGIIVSIQQTPTEIDDPFLIEVPEYDVDLIWRYWVDGAPGDKVILGLSEAELEAIAILRAQKIALRNSITDDVLADLTDEELEEITYLYPEWVGDGRHVSVGTKVRFQGVLYQVIQAHNTQADWTPPAVPALWVRVRDESSNEWVAGIQVTVGEEYQYQGTLYRVVQSHTTQAGWEPPNVPALWAVV